MWKKIRTGITVWKYLSFENFAHNTRCVHFIRLEADSLWPSVRYYLLDQTAKVMNGMNGHIILTQQHFVHKENCRCERLNVSVCTLRFHEPHSIYFTVAYYSSNKILDSACHLKKIRGRKNAIYGMYMYMYIHVYTCTCTCVVPVHCRCIILCT